MSVTFAERERIDRQSGDAVLSVRDLNLTLRTSGGPVNPLRGVSFGVEPGRVLAILGESGSGKSLTLKSILRVLPARIAELQGSVTFKGEELLTASEKQMRTVRGDRIAMIYQDPVAALDPIFTVGSQITETIRRHRDVSKAEARALAIKQLGELGIPSPEQRMTAYPHEMSGGMCQRIMIAIALACRPDVLLADEPTSALDVTVQAQIIGILREFVRSSNAAVIVVTHDVGVAAELADDVAVMYAGQVVEMGPVSDVLEHPRHPYTSALISSNVTLDTTGRLPAIAGVPPDPKNMPTGCAFRFRCERADVDCHAAPPVVQISRGHEARCFKAS
ncbi:hypothetical protein AYO38_08355 [bacterium SCGC AG-212-C10]|nr:hypothetical protein AYO38_08355 [bacterium SCGC AG-212-C10]